MSFLKSQFNRLGKKRILICLLLLVVAAGLFLSFSPSLFAQEVQGPPEPPAPAPAADTAAADTNANNPLPQSYEKNQFLSFGDSAWYYVILANTLLLIVKILGSLLLTIMEWVSWIFQYNGFLTSQAVTIGWPLVRDLVNMFFVVILLIIAFSTILKISAYQYKTTLLKLVLMALLVNFSKTILGFMIDFAQVIMLTFVNGFREAMLINLSNAFGITNLINFREIKTGEKPITGGEVVIAAGLAVAILVIANFTMIAYLGVLVYRIITLWILVILSPIAFLSAAFPALSKYSSEFWSKFWDMLVVGVSCAFFMWLALTILSLAGTQSKQPLVKEFGYHPDSEFVQGAEKEEGIDISITEVSKSENLLTFVVAIFLLLMGLQYAQKAGGIGGTIAGAAAGILATQVGKRAWKMTGGAALKGGKATAEWAGKETLSYMGLRTPAEYKKGWEVAKKRRDRQRARRAAAIAAKRKGVGRLLASPGQAAYELGSFGQLAKRAIGRQGGFFGAKVWSKPYLKKVFGVPLIPSVRKDALPVLEKKEAAKKRAQKYADMLGVIARGQRLGAEEIKEQRHKDLTKEQEKKRQKQEDSLSSKDPSKEPSEENLKNKDFRVKVEDALISVHIPGEKDARWVVAKDEFDRQAREDRGMTDETKIQEFVKKNLDGLDKKNAAKALATPDERAKVRRGVDDLTPEQLQKYGQDDIKERIKKINQRRENIELDHIQVGLQQLSKKEGELNLEINSLTEEISRKEEINKKTPGKIGQDIIKADNEKLAVLQSKKTTILKQRADLKGGARADPRVIKENQEKYREELEDLEIEEEVLREEATAKDGGIVMKAEHDRRQADLKKAAAEHAKTEAVYKKNRPTTDYEDRAEFRHAVQEEMKDMLTDNWEELAAIAEDAIRDGDMVRAAAAYQKVTQYGNENEFQNWFGMGSDGKGMRNMVEKVMVKRLGMAPEQGKFFGSDLSYTAEAIGHWGTARIAGLKNGELRWNRDSAREMEVLAEMRKIDFEKVMRQFNRLAFFNEMPDGLTEEERSRNFQHTRDRSAEPLNYFLTYFLDRYQSMPAMMGRGRMQPNLHINMASPRTIKILERAIEKYASPYELSPEGLDAKGVLNTVIYNAPQEIVQGKGAFERLDNIAADTEYIRQL